MKKKWMLLLVMVLCICMSVCFASCGSDEEAATETDEGDVLAQFTYDDTEAPPATKAVVFVKGTWEQMGKQYGEQAKDSVQRSVASGLGSAVQRAGSLEEAKAHTEKYVAVIEERAPEILDLWKGMAAGAEVDYDSLLIANISYRPDENYCSTISIWGDKTKKGNLIAGVNSDGAGYGSLYQPAVVAFPDEGNAFIGYSGFITNCMMNEKGLCLMGSQGQEGMDGDIDYGIPTCAGVFHLAWSCDDADTAKDRYIEEKLGPGSGENFHVSDLSGKAYVVEHTAQIDTIRTDKDFGTGNYTIATNGFLNEEMWPHLFQGDEFWDDDLPRYWTEEKIIQDTDVCTVETINKALGCNSYYVPEDWYDSVWERGEFVGYKEMENGVWTENNWDISDTYTGFWSPENREAGTKNVMRGIMDPAKMNMYVQNGSTDTNISMLPEGTGNFWRLTLGKDAGSMTKGAYDYARKQLYLAEWDIDTAINAGEDVEKRQEDLATAKALLMEGISYQNKANICEDTDQNLLYLGKAASVFCECQCYAQKAQDDPTKMLHKGENYVIY